MVGARPASRRYQASFADFLTSLLETEQSAKTECTRQVLKLATLPVVKTIESRDSNFATGAPKQQIQELAPLTFIVRAENVVLFGPSGVGKRPSDGAWLSRRDGGDQDTLHHRS